MDWNKVDLNSSYERSQSLISSLSFDEFLLEIECNIREIDHSTVIEEFRKRLQEIVDEAEEIFESNLVNIVEEAQKRRSKP